MVSFLIFIIVLLVFFRIGLYFSKIRLTVNKINISENNFRINMKITLYIFYKFKVLNVVCTENGLKIGFIFISYKKILKNMNVEEFADKTFEPISIKKIKHLNILLEKIKIDCRVGTEDLFITVSIVTILSIFISVILEKRLMKEENKKVFKLIRKLYVFSEVKSEFALNKYRYKITPVFGKNIFLLKGDLSVSFKTRRIGIFLTPKEHTKFKILVGG